MGGFRMGAAVAVSLLLATACGGDDGEDGAIEDAAGVVDVGGDATADDVGEDQGEATAATPECSPTSGSFAAGDGTTMSPTSALAARILDGQAYTIYLAEREISPDEVGIISVPEAQPGEVIVTVAITTFNAEGPVEPVVPGEVIEYTPDFGVRTFVVTADVGGTLLGNSADASGTVTVDEVDGLFCAEVTYTDGEKNLTATISAPLVDV